MPTDSIRDAAFCDVLNRELVCALGCTEPIAVAYAAALASQTLGCEPDHMDVACSGNIIKNVKSVTVPNSGGMHGIEAAAVLGAVGGDAKSALEVLATVAAIARRAFVHRRQLGEAGDFNALDLALDQLLDVRQPLGFFGREQ